jgi:hypothetical protein
MMFIISLTMNKTLKHSEIIDALGGPAQISRDLGFNPESGIQRVHNWRIRGIPPKVLLDHKEYFDRAKLSKSQAEA